MLYCYERVSTAKAGWRNPFKGQAPVVGRFPSSECPRETGGLFGSQASEGRSRTASEQARRMPTIEEPGSPEGTPSGFRASMDAGGSGSSRLPSGLRAAASGDRLGGSHGRNMRKAARAIRETSSRYASEHEDLIDRRFRAAWEKRRLDKWRTHRRSY